MYQVTMGEFEETWIRQTKQSAYKGEFSTSMKEW